MSVSDSTRSANGFLSFVKSANGLPAYSYVELFNDHPGISRTSPRTTPRPSNIVNSIMSNPTYKNNTVIIVTEDDTQNGNNGPDHVSNTYRVPLVVIGSPKYVKQHYLSHVAYTTSNVIAAMERVMENVKPGHHQPERRPRPVHVPDDHRRPDRPGRPARGLLGPGLHAAVGHRPGTPPRATRRWQRDFTGSATGGTAPYTYSWNFGDGRRRAPPRIPSHTYTAAGTYTATLTVTDSASPANTATSSVHDHGERRRRHPDRDRVGACRRPARSR